MQNKEVKGKAVAHVPYYLDLLGGALDHAPGFLKKFGNLETKLLTYDIDDLSIEKPVFVSGLARSGSTILLEILNDHPDTCSYQYRDYPFVHVNYFWNTLRGLIPSPEEKIERAHKDRIMINAQSPEALDEILWMSFFDTLHSPEMDNILNEETENPEFEAFYKNSLLKLLALRKSKRVVLKNNYHISRLQYLLKMFPDARFILPIRSPEEHIYSLVKQHRLLSAEQENDPRGLRYMRRYGHFEFGLDFRPMNLGDTAAVQAIMQDWNAGQIVSAYARYWADVHGYIFKTLKDNPALNKACRIVRYDDLCGEPKTELAEILAFCGLENPDILAKWESKISAPQYYTNDFTEDDKRIIQTLTGPVAALFWPD